MLLTVREFIHTAKSSMPILVERHQAETGRGHDQETAAWRDSLTAVASMLEHADLGDPHVQLNGRTGNLALEYRLPAASSWCDLVLLGRRELAPAAVMVELKHWNVASDRREEGLLLRRVCFLAANDLPEALKRAKANFDGDDVAIQRRWTPRPFVKSNSVRTQEEVLHHQHDAVMRVFRAT